MSQDPPSPNASHRYRIRTKSVHSPGNQHRHTPRPGPDLCPTRLLCPERYRTPQPPPSFPLFRDDQVHPPVQDARRLSSHATRPRSISTGLLGLLPILSTTRAVHSLSLLPGTAHRSSGFRIGAHLHTTPRLTSTAVRAQSWNPSHVTSYASTTLFTQNTRMQPAHTVTKPMDKTHTRRQRCASGRRSRTVVYRDSAYIRRSATTVVKLLALQISLSYARPRADGPVDL